MRRKHQIKGSENLKIVKKYILRILGVCIGLGTIIFGILDLMLESSGLLVKIDAISFLILGACFVFYGVKGRGTFLDG